MIPKIICVQDNGMGCAIIGMLDINTVTALYNNA